MDQEASMVSSRSRPIRVHRRQARISEGNTKPLLSIFR